MKIEKVFEKYKQIEKDVRCPICGSDIEVVKPASVICKQSHCFDISKKGYINFATNNRQTMYTKELFASRRKIFDRGYYEPLAREVMKVLTGLFAQEDISIVDVGSGEGYYSGYIESKHPKSRVYAIDSAKDGILMGAREYKDVKWMVGNLVNLPFKDKCIDVVLEIFAPANYQEFKRVLSDRGYIVKVVPGKDYLKELRDLAGIGEYISGDTEEHFGKNLNLYNKISLKYQKKIPKDDRKDFLIMSPIMFGRDIKERDADKIDILTFDFDILIGK